MAAMRYRALLVAIVMALAAPGAWAAKGGRLGGVVLAQGTPQLGAIVVVTPAVRPGVPVRLVTDGRGGFASQMLEPGAYSVRVKLAGFLPAFQPQVKILSGETTLLQIELGSIFSSVEQLRHSPRASSGPDEWKWVLRSATLTRPVLRFSGGRVVIANAAERAHTAHGRAELTTGSLSSWSPVNPQNVGTTSFLYDQALDGTGHLLLAGTVGYDHAASAGFAATWTPPAGAMGDATQSTTIVFRQSQLNGDGLPFHGFEIDHTQRMQLSDGVEIDYGGQYIVASMQGTATAARPEARIKVKLDPRWTASLMLGSDPFFGEVGENPTESLDNFATPLEQDGRLEIDRAWHEELTVERQLTKNAALTASLFHDADANTAIFGRGAVGDSNTIADPFSDAFVYDGGALRQWGARLSYKQKLSDHWQAALLYDSAEALAPTAETQTESLLGAIRPKRRDLAGGRITGRLARWGTELSAGYQWVDGPMVSRPDPFGAAQNGIEPYLNISLRQPLPAFFCCRIVAIVDVRNLLAQGYVTLDTLDGQAILISAARSVRGGLAFQF